MQFIQSISHSITQHAELASPILVTSAIENASLTVDSTTTITTTTAFYPWRQVEEAQAARYHQICRHFEDNIRHVIQGNHQMAFLAADRGFSLVQELYHDLLNTAGRFPSDTAGDRLLDLVRFCFGRAFEVGNTDWPCRLNRVSEIWNPQNVDTREANWMMRRGRYLVVDLAVLCGLFDHSSARLRAFPVKALDFVAESNFEKMVRARSTDYCRLRWKQWKSCQKLVLRSMSGQIHNADPFIRDAAGDAPIDQDMRIISMFFMSGAWRLEL